LEYVQLLKLLLQNPFHMFSNLRLLLVIFLFSIQNLITLFFIGTKSIDLYFPSRNIDINGSIFLFIELSSSIICPSFVFLTLKYSALLSFGQITNGTLSITSIP